MTAASFRSTRPTNPMPELSSLLARRRDDYSIGTDRRAPAHGPELRAGNLVASVVARAHERPRLDVLEPEGRSLDLHLGELVGVVIALDRQMLQRRPQVLTDREDVDVDRAERLERLRQLGPRLAEADHERALRMDGVPVLVGVDLGPLENAQGSVPAGPLPDRLLEPAD